MARTLGGTLAAAQELLDRRPIVSVLSSEWDPNEIPFRGNVFSSSPAEQDHPSMIGLSGGAMFSVNTESGVNYLGVYKTDPERTAWEEGTVGQLAVSTSRWLYAWCCELDDGSIGIVGVWKKTGGALYLSYLIVDYYLNVITALTDIESLGNESDVWVGQPHVVLMTDDNYLLVYAHQDLTTDTYNIKKRTATDFTDWSAASNLSIGGLDSPYHKFYDVSLLEIDTADVYLWFSYVDKTAPDSTEQKNIYYSVSADYGMTWNNAVAMTTFSNYKTSAVEPHAVQKSPNNIRFMYIREAAVLSFNTNSPNWGSTWLVCDKANTTFIGYDNSLDKLYVGESWTGLGDKVMCAIRVADAEEWEIEQVYSHLSTPVSWNDFHSMWVASANTYPTRAHWDPPLAAFCNSKSVVVVNHNEERIWEFNFGSYAATELVRTVDRVAGDGLDKGLSPSGVWCDHNTNRVYVLMSGAGHLVGYFDLTEPYDPETGYYSFHTIFQDKNWLPNQGCDVYWTINTSLDFVAISHRASTVLIMQYRSDYQGELKVYKLSSGSLHKRYFRDDAYGVVGGNSNFHKLGMSYPIIVRGSDGGTYILGNVTYFNYFGEGDKRGQMRIRMADDLISYVQPSYASLNNYDLHGPIDIGNDEIIVMSEETYGGILIHNFVDMSWEVFNNVNVLGLPSPQWINYRCLAYESDRQIVYIGYNSTSQAGVQGGVYAFSRLGNFHQAYYRDAVWESGAWSWEDEALLAEGLFNSSLVPALDPDSSMWVQYRYGLADYYLKWDREGKVLELADLIPNGTEVTVEYSLDGLNTLTFSLAKGYLWDRYNYLSIYAPLVQKGRKIDLKFGEVVNGTEYWENQGTFLVSDLKISYVKGDDPIAEVVCYDRRVLWGEYHVTATKYFDGGDEDSGDPDVILKWVLGSYQDMDENDWVIPSPFDNSYGLYCQWLDMSLNDIVEELVQHFGYTSYMNMDGDFSLIRVTDSASIDHTYSDLTMISDFTPDDSYSNYTNRVTAVCESRDWIEVTYDEEPITSMSGTIGWWGETTTKTVWFSEDHNRRCLQPRLGNVEQPKANYLFFFESQGSIDIIFRAETYVIVEVEGPDLKAELVALILALGVEMGICAACDGTRVEAFFHTGWCGACFVILTLLLTAIFGILATVAHWSFELFARPVGQEHLLLQHSEDDEEMQEVLGGMIVEQKLDSPLCYELSHLEMVAEQEIMVVRLQRKRLSFTKITHLQDELGDTIRVPHPITSQPLDIFVVGLTRRFQKAEVSGGEGYFLDDIEGWRV